VDAWAVPGMAASIQTFVGVDLLQDLEQVDQGLVDHGVGPVALRKPKTSITLYHKATYEGFDR
jgi:hypothetical protein